MDEKKGAGQKGVTLWEDRKFRYYFVDSLSGRLGINEDFMQVNSYAFFWMEFFHFSCGFAKAACYFYWRTFSLQLCFDLRKRIGKTLSLSTRKKKWALSRSGPP